MHFIHIWNIQDERRKGEAIDSIEKSLSAIGVESGNCVLRSDKKRSGKTRDVVMKPSLSGAVASRLFRHNSWSSNDKVWKDVCMSKQNNLENGQARLKRWRVWETLEDLQRYFTGLVLLQEDKRDCKARVDAFGAAFIATFGETHVTHYIVRNCNT